MSNSASQLSTKYFYKSHRNEVSKYITNDMSYINIVNSNSNVPTGMFKNEIRVDTDTSLEQIFDEFSKDNKYDLVILTDIFELTDDLYSTLKTIKSYLNDLNKKSLPVGFEEKLSHKQLATEFLMLSLRQSNGFNVKVWENYFGLKLQQRELDFVNKLVIQN